MSQPNPRRRCARSFSIDTLEDRRLLAASASGVVFQDLAANGHRDTNEPGLPGVRVYVDLNNDGVRQDTEPQSITDRQGKWSFDNLSTGVLLAIRQVVPTGWAQTAPNARHIIKVKLAANENRTGLAYGDQYKAGEWVGFGGSASHTAVSPVETQALDSIHWQTKLDLGTPAGTAHYGSPVSTRTGITFVPVKTSGTGGFKVVALRTADGTVLWEQTSDFALPAGGSLSNFSLALTRTGRLYWPGAGGTVYYREHADTATPGDIKHIAFYGMDKYNAAKAAYDASLQINTPITVDAIGNVFFGYQATGDNPKHLKGGVARLALNSRGTRAAATDASADSTINKLVTDAAPALSPDGTTLYVAVHGPAAGSTAARSYLLALDSTTLQTKGKVALVDPGTGAALSLADTVSASPMVAPDGDVYFGVPENGTANAHHGRGWLLRFSADLATTKTPGSFGRDVTASIVPASLVPSYHGASTYLILTSYNDDVTTGGAGVNKLALLDPAATQTDPISNKTVMKEVQTIVGATADATTVTAAHPGAVKAWALSTAVVDPITKSILASSADGVLYRWDLGTNTFTQKITLTPGAAESPTPTTAAPDGTTFAIRNGTLFAVGKA